MNILYGGLGVLVVLLLANLYITFKTKKSSKLLVRINYLLGILLLLVNSIRILADSYTMVVGNIIVLISLLVAWVKMEKAENRSVNED